MGARKSRGRIIRDALDHEAGRMKQCKRCHQNKPATDFHYDSRLVDGRASLCIACDTERRRGPAVKTIVRNLNEPARPRGKPCPRCYGMPWRVDGKKCRRCGLLFAEEVVEIDITSRRVDPCSDFT